MPDENLEIKNEEYDSYGEASSNSVLRCKQCGYEMPNDSVFCPRCGEKCNILSKPNKTARKKVLSIVISIFTIAVIVVTIIISINEIGKANLQNKLIKDWYRYSDGYYLILDFSKEKIEYKFYSTYYNTTIGTYYYKVISPDTIEISMSGSSWSSKVSIRFSGDNMMTMTPAITSSSSSEYWFVYD